MSLPHSVGHQDSHGLEDEDVTILENEYRPARPEQPQAVGGNAWGADKQKHTTDRLSNMGTGSMLLHQARQEIMKQLEGLNVAHELDDMEDEQATTIELLTYRIEKFMNSRMGALYQLLFIVLTFFSFLLGTLWYAQQHWPEATELFGLQSEWAQWHQKPADRRLSDDDSGGGGGDGSIEFTWPYCVFIAYQVILTAGIDTDIDGIIWVPTYMLMVLVGLLVLGLLIGMLTEGFTSLVQSIHEGDLKAIEKDHTLVLGWSEGTVRLVCQLAFLRRQYQLSNDTWACYFMPWLKTKPSTSVADSTIVIMCNTKEKSEMESLIEHGFGERGILRRRTRMGCDVVCRKGDPSNVQDLQRVSAHRAKAIVLQLSQDDKAKNAEGFDPEVEGGATLRALMALRFVLNTTKENPPWKDLRIVVEINQESRLVKAARFNSPVDDRQLVYAQNHSTFLNGLLFSCIGQPGLAQVQMELMSFDSAAIKFRKAKEFIETPLVGKIVDKVAGQWEDAVLLGVIPADNQATAKELTGVTPGNPPASPKKQTCGSGILPDENYEIKPDDQIIFLCRNSMPKPFVQEKNTDAIQKQRTSKRNRSLQSPDELEVLVCGWRHDWDDGQGKNGSAFMDILELVAYTARQDTMLHFLNEFPKFEELMGGVMQLMSSKSWTRKDLTIEQIDVSGNEPSDADSSKPRSAWIIKKSAGGHAQPRSIRIFHTAHKPYDFEFLEKTLAKGNYKEAIVVPPISTGRDSYAADTCILGIILILRETQQKLGRLPLHIVAENALDSTSKLAMVPVGKNGPLIPDFVNTQAMRARALCQVLAYPEMANILEELFSPTEGSATLLLVPADVFFLHGQTVNFKQLKAQVKTALDDRPPKTDDVCLGYQKHDGELVMPPKQQLEEREFDGDDRLIILTRKAMTTLAYMTMVQESQLR
jgi:hypothetical protein